MDTTACGSHFKTRSQSLEGGARIHQEKFQPLSPKLFLKTRNKMHLKLILQTTGCSHRTQQEADSSPSQRRRQQNTARHARGALRDFVPHRICLQHVLLRALPPAPRNANTKVIFPSNSTDIRGNLEVRNT